MASKSKEKTIRIIGTDLAITPPQKRSRCCGVEFLMAVPDKIFKDGKMWYTTKGVVSEPFFVCSKCGREMW